MILLRPASDYTKYTRERADIVKRGVFDFSGSLFRSATFASAYAPRERPTEEYGILTGFSYNPNYLLYPELNPGSSDFTVECFFKSDTIIGYKCIWAFDYSGPWTGLCIVEDRLFLDGIVGGTLGTIVPNTWYFAAITRSGSNWYGTLNDTTVLLETQNTFNLGGLDLSIGGDYYEEALHASFSGSISNFRYVKRALYSPETTTIPDRPLQNIDNTELLLIATRNAKFADTSDNHYVATGDLPGWSPGPSESYGTLDFIAYSNYLIYNNFNIIGDFTIECFFKYTDPTIGDSYLWSLGSEEFILQINDQILNISINDDDEVYDVARVETDTWYHVAVTRYGNRWCSSLNGFITYQDIGTFSLEDMTLYVGNADDSSDSFFSGSISNFRVSNYARYTTDFTVPTPPLSSQGARLLLLAKKNAPFADSSGNNLVAEGRCDWLPGPIPTIPPPFQDYGIFTGFDQSCLYYDNLPVPQNFTLELFFRSTYVATVLYENLFSFGFGYNAIRLYIRNSTLTTWYGGSDIITDPVVDNQWYHIAVTRSGSSWYFSINGTTTFQLDKTITISSQLTIGGFDIDNDVFYNGSISNFRISNFARYTDTENGYTVPSLPMTPAATDVLLLLAKPEARFADSSDYNRTSTGTCGWAPGPINYTPP